VPDPQDKETFLRSKLDWAEPAREPHRSLLDWYRALLSLRRSRPELTDPRLDQLRVEFDEDARWLIVHRGPLRIAANLGDGLAHVPAAGGARGLGKVLLASDPEISVKSGTIGLPPASFAVAEAR
jgi:maltooligosyltrehalose trehalohydrolase